MFLAYVLSWASWLLSGFFLHFFSWLDRLRAHHQIEKNDTVRKIYEKFHGVWPHTLAYSCILLRLTIFCRYKWIRDI